MADSVKALAYRIDDKKRAALRHLFLKAREDSAMDIEVENIPHFLCENTISTIVNTALVRLFDGEITLATSTAIERDTPGHGCISLRTKKQRRVLLEQCESLDAICLSRIEGFQLPLTGILKYASEYNSRAILRVNEPAPSVAELFERRSIDIRDEHAKQQTNMNVPRHECDNEWTVVAKGSRMAFKAPIAPRQHRLAPAIRKKKKPTRMRK